MHQLLFITLKINIFHSYFFPTRVFFGDLVFSIFLNTLPCFYSHCPAVPFSAYWALNHCKKLITERSM